ncbi:MAG: GntR family transcriptional regulator [Propionibacteriaceae bacterium]|jgi:GntR family transcriptional regulator|nr:GntR family transcriptional regulator [Propionibacteriaceae bacterium]
MSKQPAESNGHDEEALLALPEIQRNSDHPIWFQLMRVIEHGIQVGIWPQGGRLPSEHQFCEHYGISRTSVREALSQLEKSGIIQRKQGKGAFVVQVQAPWSWTMSRSPGLLGYLDQAGRSVLSSSIVRAGVERLPPWVSAVLRTSDNTGIREGFVLERLRGVENLALSHSIHYMPKRLHGVLPNIRHPRASLYDQIRAVSGIRITKMERSLEAALVDRRLGRMLGLESGHPILVIEAVAYDQDNRPFDVSRSSIRTDRLPVTVDSVYDLNDDFASPD